MARQRMLHPGFFTDGELLSLPALYRVFFAGLWVWADREGRLEDKPIDLKIRILPADDVNPEHALQALAGIGRVIRYTVNGKRYLFLPTFPKYQKPHQREAPSTIPAPPEHSQGTPQPLPRHDPSTAKAMASRAESESESVPKTESGGRAPAPVSTAPVGALGEAIAEVFRQERGGKLSETSTNQNATRALMKLSDGDDAEILRRWRIGLQRKRYPTCTGLPDLVKHWDAYSADETVAKVDPRKGSIRAEDADKSAFAEVGVMRGF